mgnify:CR=1 FL=1
MDDDTWELPQDWQDAIANPSPDAELDPAVLAATVFFQEHAFIYGLERAEELQSAVEAAIARVHVDPAGRIARILDGAGWTDKRLIEEARHG